MSLQTIKIQRSTNTGIISAATGLAANVARISYKIQNLGMNPLFVKEGTSGSATDFTYVLAAGSANDNGTGGTFESPAGEIWVGAVTIAGTTPRYTVTERLER